jgi:hypothetical protein
MLKPYWRLAMAVIVLVTSLALLLWNMLPSMRIVRRQRIQPSEMQLPTPESYAPLRRSLAWEVKSIEAARANHNADRFVLIC